MLSQFAENDTGIVIENYVTSQNSTTLFEPLHFVVWIGTKAAVATLLCISFIVGMPGNILVCLVHASLSQRSATDWMIFYIAVCDVMTLLTIPVFITQIFGALSQVSPNFLCKLHFFGANLALIASYLFCACTAVERYVKVAGKHRIDGLFRKCSRYMWIPVLVFSSVVTSTKLVTVTENGKGHCIYGVDKRDLVFIEYVIMLSIASVSSAVMCICYIATGVILIRKSMEFTKSSLNTDALKTHKSLVKITKALVIVTIVFLITANLPQASGLLFSHETPQEPILSIAYILRNCNFFNTFLNPFIYYFMYSKFKQRSKYILQKIFCQSPNVVAAEDT